MQNWLCFLNMVKTKCFVRNLKISVLNKLWIFKKLYVSFRGFYSPFRKKFNKNERVITQNFLKADNTKFFKSWMTFFLIWRAYIFYFFIISNHAFSNKSHLFNLYFIRFKKKKNLQKIQAHFYQIFSKTKCDVNEQNMIMKPSVLL